MIVESTSNKIVGRMIANDVIGADERAIYSYHYSGSVYFLAERTATGDCAYCLSEVRDSDGRTYTQNTYH